MNINVKEFVIPDDNGTGYTRGIIGGDIEKVDPIEYYKERFIRSNVSSQMDILYGIDPFMAQFVPIRSMKDRALKSWEERYAKLIETKVPDNFFAVLESTSKEQQVELLKDTSFTPEQLEAYLYEASKQKGVTFSSYTAELLPEGIDPSRLPQLIYAEGSTVRTTGKTDMTKEELEGIVKERRVMVAKILDIGDSWHCFFTIYKALRGEEPWHEGQPHLHYISDKWGIPREEAIAQLKSRKYPKTKVHIALLDYGPQPGQKPVTTEQTPSPCEACNASEDSPA